MRILIALTYYTPHVSGLTIYVQRLARALAARGHRVVVLTSHFRRDLPYRETIDGVEVVRAPVLARLSKGVIMPTFPFLAARLMRESDVLSIHLPQFEGSLLAFLGRLMFRKRVILTYHCDLQLPPGPFNRVVNRVVWASNFLACLCCHCVITYTEDYAAHSPLLTKFRSKTLAIYPPVEIPVAPKEEVAAFRRGLGLDGCHIVGFAARFAAEKGVDYLLRAIPRIAQEIPNVKVVMVGEQLHVVGENMMPQLLRLLEEHRGRVALLGLLPEADLPKFFAMCDVLVVPSINSTESFGLVQVEAMLSGTPVVASNLPGVRVPIQVTGAGEVIPIKNERALAEAVVKVIQNRGAYVRSRAEIEALFDLNRTVEQYEQLFQAGSLAQPAGS